MSTNFIFLLFTGKNYFQALFNKRPVSLIADHIVTVFETEIMEQRV